MDIKFTGLLNRDLMFPVVIGLGSAAVVATIIATWVWGKRSKIQIPVTLVDPNVKYSLPLIDREEISHDTRRFRFELPSPKHILGLPVGQHIHLSAKIEGDLVIRAYTPVSSDDEKGYVDLVIKVYFKNVHPKYPDGGKMSQHLENMKLGDTIDVRGPSGRLQYAGCGIFYIKKLRKDPPQKIVVTKVNMIAGGTGITPMLQLIRSIFKNSSDETRVRLLYANQSEQDILLRNEIENYQKQYPRRMSVWYTIDRATEGWKYSVGFVTADMIHEHLFAPAGSTLTVLCGPPPMLALACHPALDSLGYSQQMRFAY